MKLKKLLSVTCLVTGLLIMLIALSTTLAFGISTGNIIGLSVGVLLIGLYFIYPKLPAILQKCLNIALLGVVLFLLTMTVFISVKGAKNTVTFREDCVLVLGCGIKGEEILPTLQRRLDKCITYLAYNPDVLIVVSGGQGRNETVSEAEAMERYLLAKGVKALQIIKENQSRNTKENMIRSKHLLDKYFSAIGQPEYTVACITSNYHAYRASVLAKENGLKTARYSTSIPWYLYPSAYSRETLSICMLWLLG